MRKEKFVYNTQTLRYEKVVDPIRIKLLKLLGFTAAVGVTAVVIISIVLAYFPSPKEKALLREIEQMKFQYMALNGDFDMMSKVLNNIQERDASVHRMIFGMDPVDENIWNGGTGGHDKYSHLTKFKNSGELLIEAKSEVDQIKNKLAIQSKSLDEVTDLAKDREEMLAAMPAIKPVRSDKLKRNIRSLSGFGMRFHPIFKRHRMHKGIDFTCPKGTPIQATGNGKIVKVSKMKSGYGTHVVIDHGFGFKTLYAHMSKVDVKKGQKVKRGQVIGAVGSTGTSTAAHLHYEVIHRGHKVNPIHYCMDGLTPEEYQDLANMAAVTNQSFD